MNQISNFKELKWEKSLNISQQKLKKILIIWDIVKLSKFNILEKEVEELGWQSKNLDRENKRLEHKIEIFKDPNDACQSMIALYPLDISKEKLDQIFSVILSKLPKEDIERRQSGDAKVRLINARRPTYLK